MTPLITDQQLLAYSQDSLAESEAKLVEQALRESVELCERLQQLLKQAMSGEHSPGEIWRTERLSCPSRSDWGRFILHLGTAAELDYFEFHLNEVHCSFCLSNLTDLKELYQLEQEQELKQMANLKERASRRQKYFQSSQGLITGNQ